jgi:UDP-glucose 4-epimerase
MANCLVLGANGFIGSHLVDALAEDGHFVRCFDRYKTGDVVFSNQEHHDTEIMRGDFLSTASLEAALENMEYVFHFISTTNPFTAENDPVFDLETNVKMSLELFKLCSEKDIKKVIFASTGGAIYGNVDTNGPISEDVYPRPISPYAIGKLSIENYLRYFKTKHNLPYAVLRISNPYGPRQNTLSGQGVIPIFLERIRDGKPITIYGDGSMIRDYVYVGDIASLIAKNFEKQSDGSVYNLGAGKGYSINELVEIIKRVTGAEPIIESKPTPPTFVQSVVLDTSKFFKDFAVESNLVELEEGIRKTWQDLAQK